MKLLDLNPRFVDTGGDGVTSVATGLPVPLRRGVAIAFDCPCGRCGRPVLVYVTPSLDGSPQAEAPGTGPIWSRAGDDFATMTLTPSIQRMEGCRWHGFVTAGQIVTC